MLRIVITGGRTVKASAVPIFDESINHLIKINVSLPSFVTLLLHTCPTVMIIIVMMTEFCN